jgi:hypothetical protein
MTRTCVLAFGLLSACNMTTLANLDASVPVDPYTIRARVNFTDFTQPPGPSGNDQNLRLRFTNADGAQMDFVLAPVSGQFPSNTTYTIGESGNSFSAFFDVVVEGRTTRLDVAGSAGEVTATLIDIQDGYLKQFYGSYHVNFEDGGTGQGNIGVGVP